MVHVMKCTDKSWTRHDVPNSPSGRYGHRAVVFQGRMIIFGGYNGKERLNDTFEYDLEKRQWNVITPVQGDVPSPRDCHSAVLWKDRYFVVHGGGDGFKWLSDTWAFDMKTRQWCELKKEGSECALLPSGRAGHSAIVHNDKMYLFAGWNGRRTLNDLFEFDFTCNTWSHVPQQGDIPQARDSHTATLYKDQMIIVGGGDGKVRIGDVCLFDLKKKYWSKFSAGGIVNAARAGHVTCLLNDCLYVYAGGNGSVWLSEVFCCDLNAKKWTMLDTNGENAPGSYGLSAIVYKNKMVCFGGGNGKDWFQSVYEFEADEVASIKYMKNNMKKICYGKQFSDLHIVHKTCHDDAYSDDGMAMELEQKLDIGAKLSSSSSTSSNQSSSTSTL